MNTVNNTIRLLVTNQNTASYNMALDEAIMNHVKEGTVPPTLRLYQWNPPAITIGYFQSMEAEVDLEQCKKLSIDFTRRITGGGAVLHDKETTYSLILPEKNQIITGTIMESYRQICGAVILGLQQFGLTGQFVPINDILVNGKKISGNAQTRRNGCILQHGTILMDVDVKKMFSLLKVPDEKIRDKMIANVEERVTSIKHQLKKEVDFRQVCNALVKGFEEHLHVKLEPGQLLESEKEMAREFAVQKYETKEWVFKK